MLAHFEYWVEEGDVAVGGLLELLCLFGPLCCLLLLLRLPLLQELVDQPRWQVVTLSELIIILNLHLQPVLLNKHLQLLTLPRALLTLLPLALQPAQVLNVLKPIINLPQFLLISAGLFLYTLKQTLKFLQPLVIVLGLALGRLADLIYSHNAGPEILIILAETILAVPDLLDGLIQLAVFVDD